MLDRYDMEKIIKENPEQAHHIIADKLNNETQWIVLGVLVSLSLGVLGIVFILLTMVV